MAHIAKCPTATNFFSLICVIRSGRPIIPYGHVLCSGEIIELNVPLGYIKAEQTSRAIFIDNMKWINDILADRVATYAAVTAEIIAPARAMIDGWVEFRRATCATACLLYTSRCV